MKKYAIRIALGLIALMSLAAIGGVAIGWTAFGDAAEGERLRRMEQSAQWEEGQFENPLPLWNDELGWITNWETSPHSSPTEPLPVIRPAADFFKKPPDSGLRLTWLGHSTVLIEIDGTVLLTDPVWGPRSSPYTFVGPMRWYEPPVALDDLPDVDAVLISHDHYDHLDYPTIAKMTDWETTFVAPLGVGAHLEYWGVPADRIEELDWWDETQIGNLRLVATPARHASGRQVFDQNATLWASYALVGPDHRVYFGGDTGLFPEFVEIGEKLGPFDVTMVEVGAYHRTWPDWHIGPEQAIVAHQMLRGETFIPIHWGLFNLAMHGWTEPAERVRAAARIADVDVQFPRPGEAIEPSFARTEPWWPDLPWDTFEDHPFVSTGVDLEALGYEMPVPSDVTVPDPAE